MDYHKDNSSIFNSLVCRLAQYNRYQFEIMFDYILGMYARPNRCYHDFSHIRACWKVMEKHKQYFESLSAASLALVFHDIEQGFEHEIRSIEIMHVYLGPYNIPAKTEIRAGELILDTFHPGNPQTNDGKLIHDIDLYGFSQSLKDCQKDEARLRKEYSKITDEKFQAGRKGFLKRLLVVGPIYKHPAFFHLENQAQANIREMIAPS